MQPLVNNYHCRVLLYVGFMRIKNIKGLSADNLQQEVSSGGKFIYFAFTISLIVVTFKRTSGVYLIRPGENASIKGFHLHSFFSIRLVGHSLGTEIHYRSIHTNLQGGKDVTDEVMAVVAGMLI